MFKLNCVLAMVCERTLNQSNILKKVVPIMSSLHKCNKGINHQNLMASGCTIQKIKEDMRIAMGVDRSYSPIKKSRSHLLQYLPSSAEELPVRSMADSYLVTTIPLSTDIDLKEKYTTFLGRIRIGRLLEDMDIFAVMVAMKHITLPNLPEGQPSPYTIVTASVDRICFTNFRTRNDADIRMSGHVTWVGRSSIEVIVWLEQHAHGIWHKVTQALFLLAARDSTATRSAVVNILQPSGPIEKEIYLGGEIRRKDRQLRKSQHVSKVTPNDEEQHILHQIYIRTFPASETLNLHKMELPAGAVEMEKATLSNLVFSHPQDRNFHDAVFGGFLMRKAMELSWANAFLFTKYRPVLKSMSDVVFNKSIAVNSLIRMTSHVVYTHMQYLQITLYAETWHAESGNHVTTNAFHFTYEIPELVPEVLPCSYHESMMYIDGRRRFQDVMHPKTTFDPIPNPNQDSSNQILSNKL